MNMRPSSLVFTAAVLFLLAALSPAPAGAQQGEECEGIPHCGPFDEDPGEGCNGPNDPFCEGGGGGGGGGNCADCVAVYVWPDLQNPDHFECQGGPPPPVGTRLKNCSAHMNGCSSTGWCYVV